MPSLAPNDSLPRPWYAILPPEQRLLDWLRTVVQVDNPGARWEVWWRVLDGLHEQGRLNHIATPAGDDFVGALRAAIRYEATVGLLTGGEQLALLSKLRDFASPGAARRERAVNKLRENAAKGGAARSRWTPEEKGRVIQAVTQKRVSNPALSLSRAASQVLESIEAGKLPGVRQPDQTVGRTPCKRTIERWLSTHDKV
jgi:hypothetical protein